jgi:Ser/Thr protein kinase RdoA (MazF antagonist)
MLDNRYDLSPILANYPADCQIGSSGTEAVSPGGFSGSRIWRLTAGRGRLCLRRWSEGYRDETHLRWMHGVLASALQAGFHLIPVPIETQSGKTFVDHDGCFWQLEPWLPGEADDGPPPFRPASAVRITAAMSALANFHRAVGAASANQLPAGPAPGIVKRSTELHALQSGGIDRLANAVAANGHIWPELAERGPALIQAFRIAAPQTGALLDQAAVWIVPIRPCIRDIHRQHVLFTADQVTGIVDFGAMQPDHVAADIARLLGSLAFDETQLWQAGLQAYEQVQTLTEQEQRLVSIYQASGLLLAGVHWLEWIFMDGRRFENRDGVLARFDEILTRLACSVDRTPTRASIII